MKWFYIFSSKLQETKELQKLRLRPHGVSADALAIGRHIVEEEVTVVIPDNFLLIFFFYD